MACARIAWCSWIGNLLNGHDISFRKVLDCCCCIVVILALLSLFFPLPLFPYRGPGLELSENILLLTEFMLMLWFISTTFTTKAAFTGDDSTLSFLGFLFWLEEMITDACNMDIQESLLLGWLSIAQHAENEIIDWTHLGIFFIKCRWYQTNRSMRYY